MLPEELSAAAAPGAACPLFWPLSSRVAMAAEADQVPGAVVDGADAAGRRPLLGRQAGRFVPSVALLLFKVMPCGSAIVTFGARHTRHRLVVCGS